MAEEHFRLGPLKMATVCEQLGKKKMTKNNFIKHGSMAELNSSLNQTAIFNELEVDWTPFCSS